MTTNEKIIAKYIVKPSSPTPNCSKTHMLSSIDQITPEVYIPLVFLYQNDKSKPYQHVEMLKQSLSEILTTFYPLAGTIHGNSFVDCNDVGVEFTETRVDARLSEVKGEKVELIKQLIPIDVLSHRKSAILLVKFSLFECGGIAVGVCISHKLCDMSSFVVFMNAWAAQCRGDTHLIIQPSFDLAAYFPPSDSICSFLVPVKEQGISTNRLVFEREVTTNMLLFDRERLEKLKQELGNSGEVKNPTSVEAVTVFIWQNFMDATKAASSAVSHIVNIKKRAIPPIPDHVIGNCGIPCVVVSDVRTNLVQKVRAGIRAVDGDFIEKITGDGYVRFNEMMKNMAMMEVCMFTSWWRFPMYDVDFGWGKPVWICTDPYSYNNYITLMSTPSGDGIEAWINMSQDLFQKLRTNYDKL